MTKEEFITEMQEVLQTDAELDMNTVLADLDEWDSISVMATMAFFGKNFGLKLGLADFQAFKTLGDIAVKAGI